MCWFIALLFLILFFCSRTSAEVPPVRVDNIVSPPIALVGEKVEVRLLLANTGTSSWTGYLDVLITGPENRSDKISATVGPSQTVSIVREFTFNQRGIYTVSAGDKSATVRVLGPAEMNTPGDASVHETEYYCEIPILNLKVERKYTSTTVYWGLEDYEGYRCMKWQTFDTEDPEACDEYSYAYLENENVVRLVGTIHYEPARNMAFGMGFDPPVICWAWPVTSLTGDWSKWSMAFKTKYGEQEGTLEVQGEARFRVELGGVLTYRGKWGTDEEARLVKVYTDLRNANLRVAGLSGTAEGRSVRTIYMGRGWLPLREEAEFKLDLDVGGARSSVIIKYTSDMLCYRNHWLGCGGNPKYYDYLPGSPAKLVINPSFQKLKMGQSCTFQATLLTSDNIPLRGKAVFWSATGGTLHPPRVETDPSGLATVTYTAPSCEATAVITATFAGDGEYGPCTAHALVPVRWPAPSKSLLQISPQEFSVRPMENMVFRATLTDNAGVPLRDKPVIWLATAGSLSSTIGRTDSKGEVTVIYTAPALQTSVLVIAAFAGDNTHQKSSASAAGSVSGLMSTILSISPDFVTIQSGASTTLVAKLFDTSFNPLSGKTITWTATVGEVSPVTTTTDFEGKVIVTYKAPEVDGPTAVTITANFQGDNQCQPATITSTCLAVAPEVAGAAENLTRSLRLLKFSVGNLIPEISRAAGAISRGRIAVSVTITLEKETKQAQVKKDFQHEQVQTQVEVKGNSVIARISSENREGRTVILNVENSVLPVVNTRQVKVEVDGQEIPLADSYEDVLDPTNDADQAEYLILLGGEGIQVLVSLPHFSTRTITIRGPAVAAPTAWAPLLVAVSIVIIVLILLFAFRRRSSPAG
jgi:hypothetical protein